MLRWIGTAIMAFILAFILLGIAPLEADATGDPAAAKALTAVTTGVFDPAHPARSFPAQFAAVMGYEPQVAIGPHNTPILYKPTGGCSAPLGIDATEYNFDLVCKEHDLSYDVLRYAGDIGAALPASARMQADDMFGRDLHARCDQLHVTGGDFVLCHTWAELFVDVVRVNSWRQGFRPPGHENDWQLTAMLLLTIGLIGIPWVHGHLHRRAATLTWTGEHLPPLQLGPPRLVEVLLPGLVHHALPSPSRLAARFRQQVA
jgi:hypothetical protein